MESNALKIGKKAFVTSLLIIVGLMLFSGVLTKIIPQGSFDRALIDGRLVLVPDSFKYIQTPSLPIYRWFTAPLEVFVSEDATVVMMIIAFLLIVGGVFYVLEQSQLLKYFMSRIVNKFGHRKYQLMAMMIFVFMLFGSIFGLFEELIALVPITIALSYSLGWDSLVGIGMSGLAAGFGFSSATFNPFTLGIAQKIAGLPLFSGVLFRLVVFACAYIIVYGFVYRYAKKIEKNPKASLVYEEDQAVKQAYQQLPQWSPSKQKQLKQASTLFMITMFVGIGLVVLGFVIPVLSSLALPLMALCFLVGGLLAGHTAHYTNNIMKDFVSGLIAILPGAILIILAMSVKVIVYNGQILDTILFYVSNQISGSGVFVAAILIYLLIMGMNFFIGSGSAKAFLVMPLIAPLSDLVGVTRQTAVQAFIFGDGFSNLLYPTNALLMIMLGVTVVSYAKWFKWTIKLQLGLMVFSMLFVMLAVFIQYGPF